MKSLGIALLFVVLLVAQAHALGLDLYSDTLRYSSGGITATYDWNNNGTWLSWDIVDLGDGLWDYTYTWHTDHKALSHIILELTDGAILCDFSDWSGGTPAAGDFTTYSPSDPGNSNPNLPGAVYGVKIPGGGGECTEYTFSFTTWHQPVWGDFYAKDGKSSGIETLAYNAGFLLEDANDGFHIARPDGRVVPDGTLTVLLLGGALISIDMLRRKLRIH